jgi:hypothetical protein
MAELRFAIPTSLPLGVRGVVSQLGCEQGWSQRTTRRRRLDCHRRYTMPDEPESPPRDELIARVTDLIKTERRRQTQPRGSAAYRAAEAEEEIKRRELWKLLQREALEGKDEHR